MRKFDLFTEEAQAQPRPLPSITLPAVQAFSPDLLPQPLARFVFDEADRMSAPPDYIAVAAIVTMGAALGNSLTIRPKARDPFCLAANLWGAVIGDPSQRKTPALKAGMAPLGAIDKDLQEANAEAMKEHAQELERFKLRVEKKKAEARKDGAYSLELPTEPEQPPQKRAIVNNATAEKLGEIMQANPRGVLMFRDEIAGWLADFERSGREGERSFYLEAWDGLGAFTFDRIGRGTMRIETVCASVLGAIQPGVFNHLLRAAHSEKKADGLLQRFSLLVWPDARPFKYIDRPADLDALKEYEALIRRLRALNTGEVPDVGSLDAHSPAPFLRFTADAQAAYVNWISALMNRIQGEQMPEAKAAHLAKYQKALPVLALLFQLSTDPAPRAVSLESWQLAERWGSYLESHLARVYLDTPAELKAAHSIAGKWRALPESFTAKDIYSKGWKELTDAAEVGMALELLEGLGWLTSKTSTTAAGGRPSTTFTKKTDEAAAA
jgi:putative DNA primase/helicase